ncbi:Scr1 family TA system antitoxin-like transcriptional regulator [Plantactinospora sp. GCM10030261]|uniref:helix-turn-helix domain-containing protein n=1 Tax=Plantactinospora sp. GCM10030261 TaxID=3273420 RepID=UPI00361D6BCF
MNAVLRAALADAGQTAESLAERVGVDPKTVARWVTPGRIPHARHRFAAAEALGRDVEDLWPDVLRHRTPVWFREWVEWEREAVALRWYELAWIPGLLQTEAYARATLANESLGEVEIDQLVESRLSRQVILRRDRPPLFVAVIDELALRRPLANNRAVMAEQFAYLAECAELPTVQIQVVPADVGMYPGLGGPFIVAELPDNRRVAHVDGQTRAQTLDQPKEIATLDRQWERIRGDALSRQHSLTLIKEAASSWT